MVGPSCMMYMASLAVRLCQSRSLPRTLTLSGHRVPSGQAVLCHSSGFLKVQILMRNNVYVCWVAVMSNSVCTRRHIHIDSSAPAPLNAMRIAVMSGSFWRTWMVGLAFLFSIYKNLFFGVFLREMAPQCGF